MNGKLMLDSNVLAKICHPTEFREVQNWFRQILERKNEAPELLISVLADYELRKSLLDRGAAESLNHLDTLSKFLRYAPVTAETARKAAELRSTSIEGGSKGPSDADWLMAAQAMIEGATLVTGDPSLRRLLGTSAIDWREFAP